MEETERQAGKRDRDKKEIDENKEKEKNTTLYMK